MRYLLLAKIKIDPERRIGSVDRRIFGGFIEHLGRCIYGGVFEEGSSLSDSEPTNSSSTAGPSAQSRTSASIWEPAQWMRPRRGLSTATAQGIPIGQTCAAAMVTRS